MKKRIAATLSGLTMALAGCASTLPEAIPVKPEIRMCTDGKYDYSSTCLENNLSEAMKSVYEIRTYKTWENPVTGSKIAVLLGVGSGILLENGYVLTACHMSYDSPKVPGIGHINLYLIHQDKEHLLTPVAEDRNMDMMVLKIPENMPPYMHYEHAIGDSDELTEGNFTYVIGNSDGAGISLREGTISRIKTKEGLSPIAELDKHLLQMTNPTNNGDSGGAVFALRDGKIELVGVHDGIMFNTQGMSYAVKINPIKKKLEELMGEENPLKNK